MGVTAAVGAVVDTLGVAGTAAAGAAIGAGVAAATGGNALQGALIGGTAGFGGAELAGAAGLTGGAAALSTGTVASADATAVGMGYTSAADAIANSGGTITAETLGLPSGTTVADLGAVGGTASQAYANPSAFQSFIGPTGMPNVAAANAAAKAAGATGLQGLLGTAQTGAQIIGGIGQLAQGYGQMQAGKAVTPQQAGPLSPYQPGFAAQLANLINNPQTITTTPGYQFNLSNYMQQLQAKQAAQGSLVGGGALIQAGQMGQQYATSSLQQQQALLQQLTSMAPAQASAAQSTAFGNVGAQNYGLQTMAGGIGQVLNPLATLYSQYNNPSPTVS